MKVLVALAAAVLTINAHAAPPATPCPEAGASCPLSPGGWVLFVDANRRVPDFWHEDTLVIEEIDVCRHGVSFVFEGRDDGNLYLAALVFVNPSGEAWDADPSEIRFGEPWEYFESRYAELLARLNRVSGGAFAAGGRFDFRSLRRNQRPMILHPMWRLALFWRGREVGLRGYLDVYLNSVT
jgi:hypothetical protein